MTDEAELLRRYADAKSEEAFAELVRRRIDFVYAVALRKVGGDAHLAKDVAQQVFADLAKKAGKLAHHAVLSGWLFTSTHYAATQLVRAERRRRAREAKAEAMNQLARETESAADWTRVRPLLDDVVHALGERDREAVLLRFVEQRPLAEMGRQLHLTEDGARARVDRALEKMRALLARRGVDSTAAALALALSSQGGVAAPAGLAASVTSGALAEAAGAGGAVAWLAFLAMNKAKIGIAVALGLALFAPAGIELRANLKLHEELGRLQAAAGEARKENTRLTETLMRTAVTTAEPNAAAELARWRERAAVLRARPPGVVDSLMRPPTNAGWSTPAAALETMNWAIVAGDWETLAKSWAFEGENKAAAGAYFAGLGPEARERFRTPERAIAYGLLRASFPNGSEWMSAMQVYDTQVVDGPAPMRVTLWQRQPSGREFANEAIFERSANGWAPAQGGIAKILKVLIPRLDPVTGELLPAPK